MSRRGNVLILTAVLGMAPVTMAIEHMPYERGEPHDSPPQQVVSRSYLDARTGFAASRDEVRRPLPPRKHVVHRKPKPKPTPAHTTAPTPAPSPSPSPVTVSVSGNRLVGRRMMLAAGWGTSQWSCLDALWTRESNWRQTAANPSGAYGIPQALPGSKMASAGADWATSVVTQVRWGLRYVAARYGSPCAAWSHSEATGWY